VASFLSMKTMRRNPLSMIQLR